MRPSRAHHLISWIRTTRVLSPAQPRSPLAVMRNRQVGSTTARQLFSFNVDGVDGLMEDTIPP